MKSTLRYAYAGDRAVAVKVLKFLLGRNTPPSALLIAAPGKASHAKELRELASHLPPSAIFEGHTFRDPDSIVRLSRLDLDFLISVHFPYLVPRNVLDIPSKGCLNLHPALLPYNRGWHTPSWSILEGTPAGATLHFMEEAVDAGDIVHQREVPVRPTDTAHSLYKRILAEEFRVFREAWPTIEAGEFQRVRQPAGGTVHRREELLSPEIQEIPHTDEHAAYFLRRLRALTTNDVSEACYFDEGGTRYRVQVKISRDPKHRAAILPH